MMSKQQIKDILPLIGLCVLTATACASTGSEGAAAGGAATQAQGAEMAAESDDPLIRALNTEDLTSERRSRIAEIQPSSARLTAELAIIATDPDAPTFARGNALLLLGDMTAATEMYAFAVGVRAEDPNIRAAAANALGDLVAVGSEGALRLLRVALDDPEPGVQVQALQSIGTRDAEALREFRESTTNPELRQIAATLLDVAAARGAPVIPPDQPVPDMVERETPEGDRLIFEAEQRWPAANAAAGRLSVVRADGDSIPIADEVEVVGGVLPAFFSTDRDRLVYEADREIRVRDLQTGEDRRVAAGIAPRPLPFTEDFVFARELDRIAREEAAGIRIRYEVLRAPFAGGEPENFGATVVTASPSERGYYSPVRWMRVVERGDRFYLEGDSMENLPLPNPFDGARGSAAEPPPAR